MGFFTRKKALKAPESVLPVEGGEEAPKTPTHGVGPHPKPYPKGDHFDPELLASGDSRNVADQYRYWTNEAIIADLSKKRTSLEIAIENLDHDFNMGTIVRTANAFNARAVHIIGRKQWNKRGAMVTNRYLEVLHYPTIEEFLAKVAKKALIAIDNQAGAEALNQFHFPRESILIFGSEASGISKELLARCQNMVEIEQFGSTRSVNVGVASGIVMYEYVRQHVLNGDQK